MRFSDGVIGLLLLAAGAEAYAPLRTAPPARLALRAHARPLVLTGPAPQQIRLHAPQASLRAGSQRPTTPRGAAFLRPVRLIWASICVLVASLGLAARAAMAVERVTLSPMRALAAVGITGEIVAYGVLAGGSWAAWKAFGKHEMPTFYETPDAKREEVDESLVADMGDVQEMRVPRAAPAPTDAAAPAGDEDLFAALRARMQQIADAPDDAPPNAPSDSTDTWGTGSTAVLEPERPAADGPLLEPPSEDAYPGDDAGIDFPDGFPLRGEVDSAPVDDAPIASADDVAMLERMFGGKLTEDDE